MSVCLPVQWSAYYSALRFSSLPIINTLGEILTRWRGVFPFFTSPREFLLPQKAKSSEWLVPPLWLPSIPELQKAGSYSSNTGHFCPEKLPQILTRQTELMMNSYGWQTLPQHRCFCTSEWPKATQAGQWSCPSNKQTVLTWPLAWACNPNYLGQTGGSQIQGLLGWITKPVLVSYWDSVLKELGLHLSVRMLA